MTIFQIFQWRMRCTVEGVKRKEAYHKDMGEEQTQEEPTKDLIQPSVSTPRKHNL